MSHSTVMVVIKNATDADDAESKLEGLLEPFDENMEMDPYEIWVDDEEVERAITFYKEHPEYCGDGDGPEAAYDDSFSEAARIEWTRQVVGAHNRTADDGIVKQEDGKYVYGYLSQYNPQSRWDWWQLGGRWNGFFQVKPGVVVGGAPLPEWRKKVGPVGSEEGRVEGSTTIQQYNGTQQAILGNAGVFGNPEGENFEARADLARVGDIDFETMRALAGQQADLAYDKFEDATKGIELPLSWTDVRIRFLSDVGLDDEAHMRQLDEAQADLYKSVMDNARQFYGNQEWVKALRTANLDNFFGDPIADWCVHTGGREAYVKRAVNRAYSTFAMLMDGEWHERGHMGWFGMSTDKMTEDEWEAKQAEMIDSLDDDVYLAVVDVHI